MTLKRTGPLPQVSEKRRAKLLAAGIYLTSTFAPKQMTQGRLPSALLRPSAHRIPRDVTRVMACRSKGLCEIQLPGCRTWGDQHQHRITQKFGGRHGAAAAKSDRASNVLYCCGMCHHVVTISPAWSKRFEHGWSLEEWQEPTRFPVLYRGELSYLDDLGGVWDFEKAGA